MIKICLVIVKHCLVESLKYLFFVLRLQIPVHDLDIATKNCLTRGI